MRRTYRYAAASAQAVQRRRWAFFSNLLECVEAISEYGAAGRARFFADRKTQKATLRELQELAESTQRLSPELQSQYPQVPWAAIAGFRNVLVHDYLGISLARVWEVVERDLPALKTAVAAMLANIGDQPPRV